MQAYTHEEYRTLLTECGFTEVTFFDSIGGIGSDFAGLLGILARKPV